MLASLQVRLCAIHEVNAVEEQFHEDNAVESDTVMLCERLEGGVNKKTRFRTLRDC